MVDSPVRGTKHSPETIAGFKNKRLGRKLTEEWKNNIRLSCKGINTKTHCPQGHEKTLENTYSKSTCRLCTLAASKRQKQILKAKRNGV